MSGVRRLAVGELTQGKLRGKALSDALARNLLSQEAQASSIKKKIYATTRNSKKK